LLQLQVLLFIWSCVDSVFTENNNVLHTARSEDYILLLSYKMSIVTIDIL